MKRVDHIKNDIKKAYVVIGYSIIGLIVGVFSFLYQTTFVGSVTLDFVHGDASRSLVFVLLFVGMISITYFFFIRKLK